MPEQIAITAAELGIQFQISHERSMTLKEAAVRLFRPSQRVEPFWAFRHLSFEIPRGESVAIIGRNGAGKSTLLRAIAGILRPTEGRVDVTGRVLPLIEINAGFLPELSAIDNIYLNGAIFGLRRREVAALMNAIIGFAELEPFRDVPVRQFSSGMFARLSFSLAVHLPSDILLVDEVLSVGDESFRQRSRDRLLQAARDGRTLLLVTHDLDVAAELCTRGLLLEHGQPVWSGPVRHAIDRYRAAVAVSPAPGSAEAGAE